MGRQCPACEREAAATDRFCGGCGAALPTAEAAPTGPYEPPAGAADGPGGFAPGQVLASRYCVVAPLGRGGMGEVYRADDLTLGQAVALKFLPPGLARDPDRLTSFRKEVAAARNVSHPNVCRVYDLTDHEGRPFLAMEYIDGEDLARLLRRVGRLPEEKGLEVARQLCAALAAVHERGLLHRDLKPANVMLDGRGKVRLADFGLAAVAGEAVDIRSGTPAYMAPEQLAGREVTTRSDIYALGLVLYEVFTGRPAFPARDRDELLRQQAEATPTPSSHLSGINPAVERVILRCLEREPKDRPRSAYEVAAALPSGDPLAAALAAGETPSPELVAAAGGQDWLAPRHAVLCLALTLLLLVTLPLCTGNSLAGLTLDADHPPEVLAADARRLLLTLGYNGAEDTQVDSAFGFEANPHAVKDERGQTASFRFWYRQAPSPLVPSSIWGSAPPGVLTGIRVSATDPPAVVPGMVGLWLDGSGHLLQFQAQAARPKGPANESSPGQDWYRWLNLDVLGFDLHKLEQSAHTWCPPVPFTSQQAWEGRLPGTERQVRVEAASYQGLLVYFVIRPPDPQQGQLSHPTVSFHLYRVLFWVILVTAMVLAVRHMRQRRADTAGATRIAVAVFVAVGLVWGIEGIHFNNQNSLSIQALAVMIVGTFIAVRNGCYYLALELLIRRYWPHSLTSWARLLAGRLGDPLLGRHVLYGVLAGTFAVWAQAAVVLVVHSLDLLPLSQTSDINAFTSSLVVGRRVTTFVFAALGAIHAVLFLFMVLLLMRLLLARQTLATAGAYLVYPLLELGTLSPAQLAGNPLQTLSETCYGLASVFVATRFGFLAAFTFFLVWRLLHLAIITWDLRAWYAAPGLVSLTLLALLGTYGAYTAVGGGAFFRQSAAAN